MLFSQDFNRYEPIQCGAPIPEEFITSSTRKYELDTKRINTSDKNVQRAKELFYLENNFVIDELLLSGKVLFNDPVSKYLNQVADNLLKDDPELRKWLRFYAVKSNKVNAFATDRGTIFVNLGLIARLENEAQLAYIMAHEITHYIEKHNINSYVEFQKIERNQRYYRNKAYHEELLQKSSYSKELEFRADSIGLDIFLNTNYSLNSLPGVFDILSNANYPYQNKPFDSAILEGKFLKISTNRMLEEVDSIPQEEEEGSTHPSSRNRKQVISEQIAQHSNQGRQAFILPETDFQRIKKIAKFELCQLLLGNRSYQNAVYYSSLLLQEYPNNYYLKTIIAQSLYGLAQYRNAGRKYEVESYPSFFPGEQQQAYHILKNLSDKELNVLAARYCWNLSLLMPSDEIMQMITEDMLIDLISFQFEDPFSFFQGTAPKKEINRDSMLLQYAFADTWSPNLEALFEKGMEQRETVNPDARTFSKIMPGAIKSRRQKDRLARTKGHAAGIDRVVFVNPGYLKVDSRKEVSRQYIESENKQTLFINQIEECAHDIQIDVSIMDINSISQNQTVNFYNDIIVLNGWLSERLDHDMPMICSNYREALQIAENQKTPYFAYSGAYSARLKKNPLGRVATSALILPPLSPSGIYFSATPRYNSYFFTKVYDIKANKEVLNYSNFMTAKDHEALVGANIYWILMQMKNKP